MGRDTGKCGRQPRVGGISHFSESVFSILIFLSLPGVNKKVT